MSCPPCSLDVSSVDGSQLVEQADGSLGGSPAEAESPGLQGESHQSVFPDS